MSFSAPLASVVATPGAGGGATSTFDSSGANLITVSVAFYLMSGISISDNKGNTYTSITSSLTGAGGGVQLWYCANPIVGSGHTVTVTGSSAYPVIRVHAWNGAASSSPLDVFNSASVNSVSSKQPGSVTPSTNNQLVIVVGAYGASSPSETIDSPFTTNLTTTNYNSGVNTGGSWSYEIQTTATARNPTCSGATTNRAAGIATFKAAAGGGSGITYPELERGTRGLNRGLHAGVA